MAEQKLTVKQSRFVDYYIETGNATEAARLAGYSAKTAAAIGAENLIKPNVSATIEKRMAERGAKRIASADEVLQKITEIMRDEYAETKDVLKAAELMGKRHQLFTDRALLTVTELPSIVDDVPEEKAK